MSLTRIKSTGIESNAIVAAIIADGSITADKIATNAVVAATIAAGAITADKIAANSITLDKLEPNTATQIASAGGGGSGVVLMSNTLISSNLLIPEGKNALSIGPITIAVGSNVTISAGQRWVII
jgi:hypothetical protein